MSPQILAAGRRIRHVLDLPGTFRAFQVLAVITLLIALFVGTQQIRLNNCVVRYMDDNNQSSQQRAEAAESDRQALDTMVTTIAGATNNQIVRDALSNYIKARSDADKKRAANPLPGPPSAVC